MHMGQHMSYETIKNYSLRTQTVTLLHHNMKKRKILHTFQAIELIRKSVFSGKVVAIKTKPHVASVTTYPELVFILVITKTHSTIRTLSIIFTVFINLQL